MKVAIQNDLGTERPSGPGYSRLPHITVCLCGLHLFCCRMLLSDESQPEARRSGAMCPASRSLSCESSAHVGCPCLGGGAPMIPQSPLCIAKFRKIPQNTEGAGARHAALCCDGCLWPQHGSLPDLHACHSRSGIVWPA